MAVTLSREAIVSEYEQARDVYVLFSSSLETLIARLCNSEDLRPEITSRTKDVPSLRGKLHRKNYQSLASVPDLSGVRAIVQYRSDVDLVCALLHREFDVVEDDAHTADRPDTFGYASRHLVLRLDASRADLPEWTQMRSLRAEVQVRTILQHAWASISHTLDYKHGEDAPSEVRRKLFQVAAMIEVSDGLFEDFRREVGAVKDEYEQSTEAGRWRNLPIDVDSLRLTFDSWKPTGIRQHAAGITDVFADASDTEHAEFLRQIASLGRALHLDSVGDLADAIGSEDTTRAFVESFPDFAPGTYSLDYLTLIALYVLALSRGIDVPPEVDADRIAFTLSPPSWWDDVGPGSDDG